MRPYHAVALTLLLLSCAHAPQDPMPTLSGSLDGFHFDRNSFQAPGASAELTPEGTWRGGWVFVTGQTVGGSAEPSAVNLPFEARLSDGLLQSSWGDAPVTFGPRYVSVHEQFGDLVLRRADGGPVPDVLVVPLWIITRGLLPPWPVRAPSGRCVEVEGIGTVQLFVLPRRPAPYHLTVENHCTFNFVDAVADANVIDLAAAP